MADIVKITNGPSQWDLMMSLFERKRVTFDLECGEHVARTFEMVVDAISCGGSAERVMIDHSGIPRQGFMLLEGTGWEPKGWDEKKVKAFYVAYSADRRQGVFSSVICDEQSTDPIRSPWGDLIFACSDWRTRSVPLT